MTTKFNSFDASPLGAFVQSPLGARNRPISRPRVVILIAYIDESDPVYREFAPFWSKDVANWLEISGLRLSESFVAAVFDTETAPGRPDIPIIPVGATAPTNVQVVQVTRGATGEAIFGHVMDLLPSASVPKTIWFAIDGSPSFSGVVTQFALDRFEDLIQERFPENPPEVAVADFNTRNEQWLEWLGLGLLVLVSPAPND